jgi:uncharacterized protein
MNGSETTSKWLDRISSSRRNIYHTIFLFGILNGLIFLINGLPYISGESISPPVAVYLYTAYFSHFFFLSLVMVLLLWIIFLVFRTWWIVKILSILLFSLGQIFIFVDVRVFAHFKFHLSGIVFNAMLNPGFWDSVHFSSTDTLFSGLAIVGILAAEFWLYTLIYRRLAREGFLSRLGRPRNALIFVFLVALAAIGEKVTYGVADLYRYTPISRYEKVLPLYRPMTFGRMFGHYVDDQDRISFPEGSELNYPLPDFQYGKLLRPYNVLFILVESLRFDMLNDEIMPQLSAFGRRATVCRNHYSSGNTSRFGGFGAIYGLYGTYWHRVLNQRQGPVLIQQLIRNDYIFNIISSTELTYPEFRQTCFVDIEEEPIDNLPGEDSGERDKALVDGFIDWLGSIPPDRPFFSFLFLDAPHATFYFPEEFRKFEPCAESLNFINTNLEEDREEIFNRYRNAIHYTDHSVGRILNDIEDSDLLNQTIVIITGDHGQEFWEAGNYGHNGAYTDYQTRVPLVIWIPGMEEPAVITRQTNHIDIPATILQALGDTNDPGLYSLGQDILGGEEAEFMVLAGWDDCCLITPRAKIRFSTEAYNIFDSGAIGRDDIELTDEALIKEEQDRYLLSALEGMRKFLK